MGKLSSDLSGKLFFIRKKDQPTFFVHYLNDDYVAVENPIGACMFDEANANNFIQTAPEFEMVRANELLQIPC